MKIQISINIFFLQLITKYLNIWYLLLVLAYSMQMGGGWNGHIIIFKLLPLKKLLEDFQLSFFTKKTLYNIYIDIDNE